MSHGVVLHATLICAGGCVWEVGNADCKESAHGPERDASVHGTHVSRLPLVVLGGAMIDSKIKEQTTQADLEQ